MVEPQDTLEFSADHFVNRVGQGEHEGVQGTFVAVSPQQVNAEGRARWWAELQKKSCLGVSATLGGVYFISAKVKDFVDGIPRWAYQIVIVKGWERIEWLYDVAS